MSEAKSTSDKNINFLSGVEQYSDGAKIVFAKISVLVKSKKC